MKTVLYQLAETGRLKHLVISVEGNMIVTEWWTSKDGEDGKKQIGRQNYRSAGAGVQKVTGNFGKDIQKCAKSKLAASGQV